MVLRGGEGWGVGGRGVKESEHDWDKKKKGAKNVGGERKENK